MDLQTLRCSMTIASLMCVPGSQGFNHSVKVQEFEELVPQIVDSASSFARLDTENEGPVIVDLASFAKAVRDFAGIAIDTAKMRSTLDSSFIFGSYDSSIRCATEFRRQCEIVDDGILVSLETLVLDQEAIVAYVRLFATFHSQAGPALCPTLLRQTFYQSDDRKWILRYSQLMDSC